MKKRIIVPTDLSETCDNAIRQAGLIAKKNGSSVTLLHIIQETPGSAEEPHLLLQAKATRMQEELGCEISCLIREGSVFEAIPFAACEKDFDLMVICTHGIHGFRQKLLGSDILKLVLHVPIPVMVVQKETPLTEDLRKLILPVSSHTDFSLILDATIFLAQLYSAEVHLFSIIKAGFDWPDQLLENLDLATKKLEESRVRMVRVKEEQKVYSIGFAKQTLLYADSVDADAICVISTSSKEYYYFAPTDKELLLLNEYRIPIVCAGGIR